jgi:hypothetical protein
MTTVYIVGHVRTLTFAKKRAPAGVRPDDLGADIGRGSK